MLKIKLKSENGVLALKLHRCFVARHRSVYFETEYLSNSYAEIHNTELRITFSIDALSDKNLVKIIHIPGGMSFLNTICTDDKSAGFHIRKNSGILSNKILMKFSNKVSRKHLYSAMGIY
ncbi:g321 [Yersinia phage phiR1-37]|uniref:hypothetical protein n=1 Tax=Yersinia phage phiR1-37 TaxID=331278 RepID=UPI00022DBDEC|nr:hypothetical protein phiR1-37_gp321 [Yersinia phage phiR1-37]CCE26344.1 g321 [Yersinia phage phiR1-37]